ncbi:Poly(A) polymerase [Bimuria novae-zelandiae CBS 107.79]|uniref:Poly(A) polymerase n=1 Tax=Bimuria novae-zelandiae CBS 107.79 TaxID=1447943 RepID=A0A6A5UU55_9PLEO|nr:Poly(A) polymerase [Bimuria novae-zelandiae CBS 107.79]
MSGGRKKLGVTDPISEAQPTKQELQLNEQLIEYLKRINNFETPEGNERREKVLKHLQMVTEEFVRRVGKSKGLPQSTIDNLGGMIYTYGSYAIGVHGPDSDIDTLVVTPKTVDVDDYFKHFGPTFKELSDPAKINSFVAVPDAFVPIIKLEYDSVDIDLIFASLPSQPSIPHDFSLLDQGVLRGLDDQAIRSVNGVRTAKELLELVPQQTTFKHALRAIKVWANKRAIYGFVFGYPGGIAWAIMVARLCQLYPFACGSTILSKFFALLRTWNWPRPIFLKQVETSDVLNLSVWNPTQNYHDKLHVMPVITPSYPSMCSTHSVTHSTLKIMKNEFLRASEIVNGIADGKNTWADLFQRHTFFTLDHKYYLSVIVSSTGNKDPFDAYSGRAQSKIRLLARNIEVGNTGIEMARVYRKGIERVHRCANEKEIDEVRQGSIKYKIPAEDATTDSGDGKTIVYTTTWYVGLTLAEATKALDISYPVEEYRRLCEDDNDVFDRSCMGTKIVHTRNYDLPSDLFEQGDIKPTKSHKPKKDEKKKKVNGTKGAKRQFAETGLEVRNMSTTKNPRLL